MCLFPNDTCEITSLSTEITINGNDFVGLDPLTAVYAILAANPV